MAAYHEVLREHGVSEIHGKFPAPDGQPLDVTHLDR